MKSFCCAILAVLIAAVLAGPAFADKRVALVVGNSSYDKASRLSNPSSDAAAVAETLRAVGFDHVDLRRDLKVADMKAALRDFIERSRDADIAVVYYAGHGIEVDGVNYLIPVDAVLERDSDVHDEAVSLDRVLVAVEPAQKLRLVILDACRDNPFARSMKRTLASRSIGRGLGKVEPTSPNTLIAYASKAGSVALDGDGSHSPFTAALVSHITRPGLDLRKVFGYVRDDVLKSTSNRQEPYLYGSLGGEDLSLVPAKPAVGLQTDPQASARRDYELALQLGTRDGWDAFLSQYPDGFYANLGKGQLRKIAAEEARVAAAEQARLAEQESARLAAEGATQGEIATAAAAAKAAEQARLAAGRIEQREQEKAAAAEADRLAAQRQQADRDPGSNVAPKSSAADNQKLAALPPADRSSSVSEVVRSLQMELRRVGCNAGSVDGVWDAPAQKSLVLFNKHTGLKLNVQSVDEDALQVVKSKSGRICPLVCDSGYRADGDRCTKIACRSGYVLNDDNSCEKVGSTPSAKRKVPERKLETQLPASSVARADAAFSSSSYKKCMGPLSNCYARAIERMPPERARIWCSRRPTC